MTRAKLESLVDDLIANSIKPCEVALADAGLQTSDIEIMVLVGGMTRMPRFRMQLRTFLVGNHVRCEPDEAVAAGAAVQGAVYQATDRMSYYLM